MAVVQEPACAPQAGDVLPREPVTRGVTPAHVLTRAHEHVVHNVKVVVLGNVARGLGEHLAVLALPPLTRVHVHPGGGARHAGVAHLQRVAVSQQVAEGGRHQVLSKRHGSMSLLLSEDTSGYQVHQSQSPSLRHSSWQPPMLRCFLVSTML